MIAYGITLFYLCLLFGKTTCAINNIDCMTNAVCENLGVSNNEEAKNQIKGLLNEIGVSLNQTTVYDTNKIYSHTFTNQAWCSLIKFQKENEIEEKHKRKKNFCKSNLSIAYHIYNNLVLLPQQPDQQKQTNNNDNLNKNDSLDTSNQTYSKNKIILKPGKNTNEKKTKQITKQIHSIQTGFGPQVLRYALVCSAICTTLFFSYPFFISYFFPNVLRAPKNSVPYSYSTLNTQKYEYNDHNKNNLAPVMTPEIVVPAFSVLYSPEETYKKMSHEKTAGHTITQLLGTSLFVTTTLFCITFFVNKKLSKKHHFENHCPESKIRTILRFCVMGITLTATTFMISYQYFRNGHIFQYSHF